MFTVLILISFIPAVLSFSLVSYGLRFDVMSRSAARSEVPYEVAMQGRRAGLEKLVPYDDATDKEAWEEAVKNRDSRIRPRAFGYHQVAPKEAFHVGQILIPAMKMVDEDALPDQHHLRIDVNDDGLVHPRSKLLRDHRGPVFYSKDNFMEYLIDEQEPQDPITVLHKGAQLPDKLVLVHSHYRAYCIEPRIPITLEEYNFLMKEFLSSLQVINKTTYFKEFSMSCEPKEFLQA